MRSILPEQMELSRDITPVISFSENEAVTARWRLDSRRRGFQCCFWAQGGVRADGREVRK